MKNTRSSLLSRFLSLPMWFWLVFAAVVGGAECVRRWCFGGGCLLWDIFGFPCPTCGMTRAYFCVLMLDFGAAMRYNPAFWVFPPSVLCLIMAFYDKKHLRLWLYVFLALIAVLLTVWLTVRVIMGVPMPT